MGGRRIHLLAADRVAAPVSESGVIHQLKQTPPSREGLEGATPPAVGAPHRRKAVTQSIGPLELGVLFYPERMLDLSGINVEELATALADQTDYEHRWLIDPRTGQVAFWTSDTGIDGENAVELDQLDLIVIDPLPPYVWFQDMADFAQGVSDLEAGRHLTQSLQGRGRSGDSRTSSTSTTPN